MYLFALVMIVLNLAAFGVGIRVPFIRHPAGGTRHPRSFFRSSNSPRNASGRCSLPRRLVLPGPCAKAEVSDESPLIRGFLKKFHFFENFVPQIPEK